MGTDNKYRGMSSLSASKTWVPESVSESREQGPINTHTALGVCAAVAPTEECGSVREEGVAATPRSKAVGSLRLPCVRAEVLLQEWDVPGDKGLMFMACN